MTSSFSPEISNGGNNETCLQLALEGEKLCKRGNCGDGIAFFEAALQAGTDDFRTLSAIYSQLGNAYFYMGDYGKAMTFHKHDLTLARTMSDSLGEAKASGNLGNTLKVMGKFEEAVICCRRHLEICRSHGDNVGEGRALYNLGNVFHAKGKHLGRLGHQDPGEFPSEVKELFAQAVSYYEENLTLMTSLKDRAGEGRACGNLGNVHYLLGNFSKAIFYHEERLKIAKEFGDKSAERRAHSNLGNARIFLGEFEKAASSHYRRTLDLARELGDRAVEAQACYSLGNTYTLLKDYPMAVQYHWRHYQIAKDLRDRVGEGRACWSLGNAHAAMGENEEAFQYATKHLEISKETGDRTGEATARLNLAELAKSVVGVSGSSSPLPRRSSMERLNLLQMSTPESKGGRDSSLSAANKSGLLDDEEDFFDFISRFQSKRMDDQRCPLPKNNIILSSNGRNTENKENKENNNNQTSTGFFLPGLTRSKTPDMLHRLSVTTSGDEHFPDESFFEMLMKCQGSRIEEQRSALPEEESASSTPSAPTVPDEDFFSLIHRLQGGRLEDQRALLLHK